MSSTAGKILTVEPLARGELRIAGYLTRWDEVDREQETFLRGAFLDGIDTFLRLPSSPLCYHHRQVLVIGEVEDIAEDATGVHLIARVHAQDGASPLRWIYDGIVSGAIRSLSVGGIFTRGQRRADGVATIVGVDITECSVTAVPVLASTGFRIVEVGGPERPARLEMQRDALQVRTALAELGAYDRSGVDQSFKAAQSAANRAEIVLLRRKLGL